ncbi:hypothetical protein [Aquisalimonas asiatica]|uniref:Uncharacterized protein n=1 Tax=Aquisalimonas asiatica TaxID=406100 RepID=A0A1H8TNA2_9GAMM|nr:hypothetical protein [Aquisalimonas asiatica]SEO92341.1 hypothetical protein SAMN04488052_104332 [Aquisalimonas asiatica]
MTDSTGLYAIGITGGSLEGYDFTGVYAVVFDPDKPVLRGDMVAVWPAGREQPNVMMAVTAMPPADLKDDDTFARAILLKGRGVTVSEALCDLDAVHAATGYMDHSGAVHPLEGIAVA